MEQFVTVTGITLEQYDNNRISIKWNFKSGKPIMQPHASMKY